MDPEQQFAIVLRSPGRIRDKDGPGWVELFHPEGFVEDPVEAGRYQGRDRVCTFWDVFIAPQRSIRFEVQRDFWGGDTLVRQATVVSVTEADEHAELRVPALIRYTVRDGSIASLQAVWEPPKVIGWFFARGPAGLFALARHSVRMIGKAGVRAALSFGGTMIGGIGSRRAHALVDELRSADWAERRSNATGPLEIDEVLVCGRHVAAFLRDPEGPGALAVMLQTDRDARVQSMTALWSDHPAVLGQRTPTLRSA
jgi:steroid Delta-isomerase